MTDRPSRKPPVFHDGEITVQSKLGLADAVAPFGAKIIRDYMPDQHREFFASLPMMFTGAVDDNGHPWASAAFGQPGFVASPSPTSLHIDAAPLLADTLGLSLEKGDKIGFLGIQLETRRRNRMNGVIRERRSNSLIVDVDQSFGNCPQYIQRRQMRLRDDSAKPTVTRSTTLTDDVISQITSSDTFFIASRTKDFSADPRSGIDVSHRGGRPGFVGVTAYGALCFPDFSGNRFFNTLGNIASDPRIGLLFADFKTGDAVFLTGEASIIWDGPDIARFPGAERFVIVAPHSIVRAKNILPIEGEFVDQWPTLGATGAWQ